VVNEVLSNALKYAYPEGTAGDVRLSLSRTPEGALLEVADDGVGMPAADSGARQSLGLQLVEALAGQLGGNVRFENTDPGLAVRLTFPLPE
jgi:two-component sensor histidine kinase